MIDDLIAKKIPQFVAQARAEEPAEACALLLKSGELVPVKNVAVDPRLNFRVGRALTIAAYRLGLAAVFHSHVGSVRASGMDRRYQRATNVPWVIVSLPENDRSAPFVEILSC